MTPGCLVACKEEVLPFLVLFTIWNPRVAQNAGWEMVVYTNLSVIYAPSMNPGYTANTSVLGSMKYWKLICCLRAVGKQQKHT
jgi:hypothetical protein